MLEPRQEEKKKKKEKNEKKKTSNVHDPSYDHRQWPEKELRDASSFVP